MTTSRPRRWALAPPPGRALRDQTAPGCPRLRLGAGVAAVVISAGGLLGAVWAAARVAATPGQPAPELGSELCDAIARAVAQSRLEPLIGATGLPLLFWATLAVFLALHTLTWMLIWAVLARHRPGHHSVARPRIAADPTVLPLAWHPRTGSAPRPGHGLTPHLAAHHTDLRCPSVIPPTSPTEDSNTPNLGAGVPLTIGEANDQPVVIDLCAQRGLGLTGPGADGLARSLLAGLITGAGNSAPHTALASTGNPVVVIPMVEAERLLRPDAHDAGDDNADTTTSALADHREPRRSDQGHAALSVLDGLGPRVYQAPTLGVALTYLEQHIDTAAHTKPSARGSQPGTGTDGAPEAPSLVLFAQPDANSQARLQAILSHGAPHRIAAILTGPWPTGTTLSLNLDGTVHTPAGTNTELPALTTAFTTTQHELLALLTRATTPSPQPTPTPHAATPSAQQDSPTLRTHTEPVPTHVAQNAALHVNETHASPDQPHPRVSLPIPRTDRLHAPLPTQPPHDDTAITRARATPTERLETTPRRNNLDDQPPDEAAHATVHDADPAEMLAAPHAVLIIECFAGLRVHAVCATSGRSTQFDERREITARLSPQDIRLLACLAVHSDGIATSELLEIGWPDTAHSTARARLRTALNHLRTTLREETGLRDGAFATHLNGRYHLGAHPRDPRVWIDYTAFDQAVRDMRTHSGHARMHALEQVATHYTGVLLDGVDLDWPELEALQESARRSTTSALAQLAEHYTHLDPPRAIRCLQQLLTHEPAAQRPASMLIRLHLRDHDHPAAQRVYTELTDALATIGRQPSEKLTERMREQTSLT